MKKFLVLFSLISIIPLACAGDSVAGCDDGVVPLNMKVTGLVRHVDDYGRTVFDVDLKGSPGKATGRGVAITGFPLMHGDLPAGNACLDLVDVESGMIITEAQMVLTFADGSMIWGNSPPEGYVCFVPGFAFAPYDIMGGSGRFEGATGWVAFELDTHGFAPPLPRLVTPETGIATGEIVLP